MRAIIIDDKDARALLDQLKLEAMQRENFGFSFRDGTTDSEKLDTIHRAFHYVVCRWLQDQGCNVVR